MKWAFSFLLFGLLVMLTSCDNKHMRVEVQQYLNKATTILSKLQKSNAKHQFPNKYKSAITAYETGKRLAQQKKYELAKKSLGHFFNISNSLLEQSSKVHPVKVSNQIAKSSIELSTRKPSGFYYIVQPGEWLFKIAKKKFGHQFTWQDIFEVNQHILKNPNQIFPGQKLIIPSKQ